MLKSAWVPYVVYIYQGSSATETVQCTKSAYITTLPCCSDDCLAVMLLELQMIWYLASILVSKDFVHVKPHASLAWIRHASRQGQITCLQLSTLTE